MAIIAYESLEELSEDEKEALRREVTHSMWNRLICQLSSLTKQNAFTYRMASTYDFIWCGHMLFDGWFDPRGKQVLIYSDIFWSVMNIETY